VSTRDVIEGLVDSLSHPAALEVPCILLLLGERASHGYELVERLKEFGFVDNGTGRVYRDLRQLEDAGLVRSFWEASQMRGPARRVYELTRSGAQALAGCAESAASLARILESYSARARVTAMSRRPIRLRSPTTPPSR
jgi:PadR family transcriptional regulator PadR